MTPQAVPVLVPGMTLGAVATSGPLTEPEPLRRAVAVVQELGLGVELAAHAHDATGYLAGTDRDRAEDLLVMLERDDVDAVLCARGGYGALRLIRALDLDRLRRLRDAAPKPFIGFSDVTVLHALLARELGWPTFWGPVLTSFARATPYTLRAFRRGLMATDPFDVPPDADGPAPETLAPGRAEGVLRGGTLSRVVALLGTPWQLDLTGSVFLFEDVELPRQRLDALLTQLLATGGLDGVAGVVIGELSGCDPGPLLAELLVPLGVPVLAGLPVGHGRSLATLPLGARVTLDATRQRLSVTGGRHRS